MEKVFDISNRFKEDLLDALILNGDESIAVIEDEFVVNSNLVNADRVTVVGLGGVGYAGELYSLVGEGMMDVAVIGDVEAAPGPQVCVEGLALADRGQGVLFVVPQRHEEQLTAGLAMKQIEKLGMKVTRFDAESNWAKFVVQLKVIGAAAAEGKSLAEISELAQKITSNTEFANIEELNADSVAEAVDKIVNVLALKKGENILLGVAGNGYLGLSEEFVLFRKCYELIADKDLEIVATSVGKIATYNEGKGCTIFVVRVDEELLRLWNAPCNTLGYKK